ncbi:hypothetical protein BHE74_00046212 [Ensete ventricosum]|nr:hypothetical protein BHE74_00046212 [Ensete ventricosum]
MNSGEEEEPSAEVTCSRVDGRQLDRRYVRVDPSDHTEEARGWWSFVTLVRSYRWIAMWRTDSVGDVANKGRGRWQRGDLGGRKRRSGGCSRRSRCCYVSVALRKKTLAMSKDHERLRTATAMAVATIVLGE